MSSKINNQPQVIFFIMSCLFSHTISDPRISEAGLYCGKDKAPQKSNFIPSFIKEMENLSQLVTDHNWGTQSVNIAEFVPIYGFAQCFQDLSHTDCLLCYAASRTMLPRCLPSLSARIYLDGCFLRYDNYSFYSEETDPLRDKVICTSSERLEVQMERSVERVVDVVAKDAGDGGGFAVGEVEGVYALAQCWKTLGIDGCRDCLSNAVKKVRGCLPNSEGRVLNAGCYLRYSTHKFFKDGGGTNGGNGYKLCSFLISNMVTFLIIVSNCN
ncbi:putative non-specific serine/threonine protein kinase [Medicago truncatula]|uniref:Putative non-specific serine/threonine protein kinase n=1 Tax=Medicago truncatula TaxID=3880 RepID=A0A396H1X5_MEDTR|nr:putative non-specific serine/threonine protein kinase [Medicago truncatula]